MDFGLYFTQQLPRPWLPSAEQRLFQDALAQVELADQLGFDYAWAPEQHFLEEYSHSSAPEVFLAAASQRTSRIRLGHGVVLMPPAYNQPARVAERMATLDLISNGRAEFGAGDSKSRMELEGFGVDRAQRRAMSLEALEQVSDMMTLEPYPGHEGKYFSMPARNVVPKPTQKPHPPLWMACSDDATIHLAAQLGVGALAHGFFDPQEAERVVADYYETLKTECVPIGHAVNANVAMLNPFFCHRDPDQALAQGAEAHGFFTFAVRHYYTFGRHEPGRTDISANSSSVRSGMGADIPMRGSHAIGTPQQITDHLKAYQDVGIDQAVLVHQAGRLGHNDICASLELFAAEVLPSLTQDRAQRQARKHEELAPHIRRAMQRKSRSSGNADGRAQVVEAYGRARPSVDPAGLSAGNREQLLELQRLTEAALRQDT